ncbi:hypothetical protein D3C77_285340 [compost metagenome]
MIKPAQLIRGDAPARQLQGQPGEVGLKYLGATVGGQLLMLGLGPQSITHPRLKATGTTGTLGGAGSGDTLGVEAGHAAARVEARHTRQAGIDHHAHAINGQAGLGNVGRQHHLAFTGRRGINGRTLGIELQFAVQGAQQNVLTLTQCLLQRLVHPADFGLTGQKHQQAARLIGDGLQYAIDHPWLDVLARLERPAPAYIDRVHAPFTADHRRLIEQARQAFAFEGCRHQQNLQRRLITQQLTAIEAQGQGQVSVEAAFVEFVENQQPDALQRRIGLQTAGEDAFGDHFNPGFGTDFAVQPNPVADRLPDLLAQLAGQSLGRRAGGKPAWLKHENALPCQPWLIE